MDSAPHRSTMRKATPNRGKYALRVDVRAFTPDEVLGPLPADVMLRTPKTLYAAGDLELLRGTKRVSIIGSRSASPEGARRARKLAAQLVQAGVVIVSGLAKGIDHAAHEGALEAGGRTIAVIGTPLDKCYPAEHAELQERLCREHLVVSQFPTGVRTHPSSFVARNRTMALLSHASVIVEAGDTSGSLSQAAETQRLQHPLFFMASVLERTDLAWPPKFLATGAIVLNDAGQIVAAI